MLCAVCFHRTFACDVRLHLQEISLDRDDPPQSPAQRSQPQHEFALDRGLRIVVSDYRSLECAVISAVLQAVDHPLRGQPSRTALRLASRLLSSALGPVLWRTFPDWLDLSK
jgi:hypothetical protein